MSKKLARPEYVPSEERITLLRLEALEREVATLRAMHNASAASATRAVARAHAALTPIVSAADAVELIRVEIDRGRQAVAAGWHLDAEVLAVLEHLLAHLRRPDDVEELARRVREAIGPRGGRGKIAPRSAHDALARVIRVWSLVPPSERSARRHGFAVRWLIEKRPAK